MVITIYPRALPDQPRTTPPAIAYCNTLIDPATVTYYNYNKDGYFTLSYLKPKNIGNIKEIKEGEITNKLEKEEP